MDRAELEEVICGLHRRIALTTAGTPLQDDLIKAVSALRIAVKRISELEAQLPKEGEWIERDDGDLIWFKCSVCGKNYYNVHVLWEMMQGEYHHCPNCGSRMRKGEQE